MGGPLVFKIQFEVTGDDKIWCTVKKTYGASLRDFLTHAMVSNKVLEADCLESQKFKSQHLYSLSINDFSICYMRDLFLTTLYVRTTMAGVATLMICFLIIVVS